MKKIFAALGFITFLTVPAEKVSAQYYFYDNKYYDNPIVYEVGVSVGAINCLTDIGGHKGIGKNFVKDLNLGKTHIAGSIYLAATYQYMFALRLEATFGKISADHHAFFSKSIKNIFGNICFGIVFEWAI